MLNSFYMLEGERKHNYCRKANSRDLCMILYLPKELPKSNKS